MRFLVVDDEPVIRKVLTVYLSSCCSDIDIAVDGKDAIKEYSTAMHEGRPYSLICLDVDMPNMNGIEVLKYIRKKEREMRLEDDEKTKILMTTAVNDRTRVLEIIKNGCDGYLVKPYQEERIGKELKKLGFRYG